MFVEPVHFHWNQYVICLKFRFIIGLENVIEGLRYNNKCLLFHAIIFTL